VSLLATTLESVGQAERRTALRHLLRRPLTNPNEAPDAFAAIVRHRDWLARWFAEQPGWKLVVDPAGGFARLYKLPAEAEATRPARASGRPAFDRRRYVLLSLGLAALEETAAQTTIKRLAELLEHLSRDEPAIETFDPNLFSERRAFVDVLHWLVEHGVLGVRDGDAERWARDQDGDALYDVNERLLGQLVACPIPPALAADPGQVLHEAYPETEEGERLRARHRVFRKLLDDPVVYYDDLPAREYEWLEHSRGFVYSRLSDEVGLRVERRREGLAAVDPEGEVSDTLFPDGGSTVKHAALLLAELLTMRARPRPGPAEPPAADDGVEIAEGEVVGWMAALHADYGERCRWSRRYPAGDDGIRRLAADAMELLESFRLVTRTAAGWRPRPAIARFAPAAPPLGAP
jgi:uncharacterized protein (TIGR02678 family)